MNIKFDSHKCWKSLSDKIHSYLWKNFCKLFIFLHSSKQSVQWLTRYWVWNKTFFSIWKQREENRKFGISFSEVLYFQKFLRFLILATEEASLCAPNNSRFLRSCALFGKKMKRPLPESFSGSKCFINLLWSVH